MLDNDRCLQLNLFYLTSLVLIIPSIALTYFGFLHGRARFDKLPDEAYGTTGTDADAPTVSIMEVVRRFDVWILSFFLLFYVGYDWRPL